MRNVAKVSKRPRLSTIRRFLFFSHRCDRVAFSRHQLGELAFEPPSDRVQAGFAQLAADPRRFVAVCSTETLAETL